METGDTKAPPSPHAPRDGKTTKMAFGRYVFGLGVIAMALSSLAKGGFDPGQPVPANLPGSPYLAFAAAAFMLAAGAAVEWRRTRAWGAGALAGYYALVVVVPMNGRVILAHPTEYGAYSGAAEQLAIAAGGLIVAAASAPFDPALTRRLTRIGQIAFAICAILFGGAHFFYINLTAPLVPKWLPPSQIFWGYATGLFHIAGGLAILISFRARLAAILLTVMYVGFGILVHAPMLLADPSNPGIRAENALNLALIGVAWVVADSLARVRR
jgi:uncharacterized membrane protein